MVPRVLLDTHKLQLKHLTDQMSFRGTRNVIGVYCAVQLQIQYLQCPLSDETKKFHRDRYRDFFLRPNVFKTDTETFLRPNFFETDTETFAKVKK